MMAGVTEGQAAAERLAEAYLGALGSADLTAIISLFSEGALVHSPLYGPMAAADFSLRCSARRQNRG